MVGCSRQLCLALRNWPSPAHPGWARKAFRSSHVQPCVSPESSIGYNPIRIININNHTLAYCIYLETRKCGLRPKLVIFWSHLNSKSSPRAGPCPGTLRCPLAIQPFRQQRHRCINCRAVVAELCERSWPDRVATCCHNRCTIHGEVAMLSWQISTARAVKDGWTTTKYMLEKWQILKPVHQCMVKFINLTKWKCLKILQSPNVQHDQLWITGNPSPPSGWLPSRSARPSKAALVE